MNSKNLIAYSITKSGRRAQNRTQDAFAINTQHYLFAVADGVTNSLYPDIWAKLLVNRFCHGDPNSLDDLFKADWEKWLAPIQQQWKEAVDKHIGEHPNIPNINKFDYENQEPAASTFVGLQLFRSKSNDWYWRGVVIGDSTLIHLRDNELIGSYALRVSGEFDSVPDYFASYPKKGKGQPKQFKGSATTKDAFILSTDALSEWLLRQYETGDDAWNPVLQTLLQINGYDAFYDFIRKCRDDSQNQMKDDDVTLVIVSPAAELVTPSDTVAEFFKEPNLGTNISPLGRAPEVNETPIRRSKSSFAPGKSESTTAQIPPQSYSQLPERIPPPQSRSIEHDSPAPHKLVWVSLALSLIALLLIAVNFMSDASNADITQTVDPSMIKPSVEEGLGKGAPLRLVAGSKIYSSTGNDSTAIIEVSQEVEGFFDGNFVQDSNGGIWYSSQLRLWIRDYEEQLSITRDLKNVLFVEKTPAYSEPTFSTTFLKGHFVPGTYLEVSGYYVDHSGARWFTIQVNGIVPASSFFNQTDE